MTRLRRAFACALCALVLVAAPGGGTAHDLPGHLDLQVMVRPDGGRLHVIARVPLALLEGLALPKRGAEYLDLARLDEPLRRAALTVARTFVFFAHDERLTPAQATWRVSLPSAPAFDSFTEARQHLLGPPLDAATDVVWNDGWFDVYLLYPISSPEADFHLRPRLPGLGSLVTLRVAYTPGDGGPPVIREVGPEQHVIVLDDPG